jgi:hypothetical protein
MSLNPNQMSSLRVSRFAFFYFTIEYFKNMINQSKIYTLTNKTAVKHKLIEIGEYVDDQLTDYVMIMVTNKKNEKQMAEDLELFLGGLDQATKFSTW